MKRVVIRVIILGNVLLQSINLAFSHSAFSKFAVFLYCNIISNEYGFNERKNIAPQRKDLIFYFGRFCSL
jgi:hypothetical protein